MVTSKSIHCQARKAFTMIELIFAIVVIGVTLLTVPLMIQTNNTAMERNLAQEAIFLGAALLSMESTNVWDANSVDTTVDPLNPDAYVLAKILDIGGAINTIYGRVAVGVPAINTNMRRGGILADKHRQFFDFNTSVGALNGGFSPPAQGSAPVSFILAKDPSAGNAFDYKENYGNNAISQYVADAADLFTTGSTGVSNLKMVQVTLPVTNSSQTVVLRIYKANIGESDYAKRSF